MDDSPEAFLSLSVCVRVCFFPFSRSLRDFSVVIAVIVDSTSGRSAAHRRERGKERNTESFCSGEKKI
jgi:hypothetical protein